MYNMQYSWVHSIKIFTGHLFDNYNFHGWVILCIIWKKKTISVKGFSQVIPMNCSTFLTHNIILLAVLSISGCTYISGCHVDGCARKLYNSLIK